MSVATLLASHSNDDNWALQLVPMGNHGLACAFSDGSLKLYPVGGHPGRDFGPLRKIKAHNTGIKCARSIDGVNLIGTAAEDSVKIFDLRTTGEQPVMSFHNARNIPFLSLDARAHLLAGGTELKQQDAELHLWDMRSQSVVRSFVDSHHDDITELRFHPVDDSFLLSGSTDGYVNIYDLSVPDEDDALHQTINFASIHSAGWLSATRVYTLSHMETFAIHELNDRNEDAVEPLPLDFGDVREKWGCEYVVDVCPGFVAAGANSRSFAKLCPFAGETVDLQNTVNLNGAHGEEVVRTVCWPDGDLIYTGGEDGCVKVWRSDVRFGLVAEDIMDVDIDSGKEVETVEKKDKKHKKDKKDKKDKTEKKDKKDKTEKTEKKDTDKHDVREKKDKKDKKDKHKKDKKEKKEHRFKPY